MIGTQILQRYVVDYGPWMLSWLIIFNAICSLLRTLDTQVAASLSLGCYLAKALWTQGNSNNEEKHRPNSAHCKGVWQWRQRGKLSRPGGNLEPKALGTQTRIWIMNQMTKWAGYPMSMEILRGALLISVEYFTSHGGSPTVNPKRLKPCRNNVSRLGSLEESNLSDMLE